jgi:hypothetical protein
MGVPCIVDSIAGKLYLVGEQNVTNHMGVRVSPKAQFQSATHVHRFKLLDALLRACRQLYVRTKKMFRTNVGGNEINILLLGMMFW